MLDLDEIERDNRSRGAIAPGNFYDWRQSATSFEGMSVFMRRIFNATPGTGEPERLPGAIASTNFFDVLGVSPLLGRGLTASDAEAGRDTSVVIGYGLWQRRFCGSLDVVNRTMRLNGQPVTIVGVMPASMNFPQNVDFWIPAAHDLPPIGNTDPRENRGLHYLRGIARLTPGTSIEQANAELDTIAQQLARQYPDTNSVDPMTALRVD